MACSKLHLQCNVSGMRAATAPPELGYARLEPGDEEARTLGSHEENRRRGAGRMIGLR